MALTDKREAFKNFYIICWDATKAATLAGYKTPRQTGYKLLRVPEIKAEIDKAKRDLQMSANEITLAFSQLANTDLGDFSGVRTLEDLKDHPKSRLVKKIKTTSKLDKKDDSIEIITTEIELHNPQSALDSLAKIRGLYKETNLNINIPWDKLTNEQIKRIAAGEDVSNVLSDTSES